MIAERTSCAACGGEETAREVLAREMMFGMGDEFTYLCCRTCGSLTLKAVADLDRYYPADYYSLENPAVSGSQAIRRTVAGILDRAAWHLFALGVRTVPSFLRLVGARKDEAILDVGAGGGALLHRLRALGFTNLTGVDPHATAYNKNGITLLRGSIKDAPSRYDIVMFHHSLEHVENPLEDLRAARNLLTRRGRILVRIPIAAQAWQTFGPHWVQLDAPRHTFLPTVKGVEALASRAGLAIRSVVFDSSSFQFSASRAYQRGQTLRQWTAAPLSGRWFVRKIMELPLAFKAQLHNAKGTGDQAAFVLVPFEG